MPSLIDYKGLQVVDPQPTGDGGLAIQNDFKSLVDWNPRSVWSQSADPTANDDEGDDFYPGSMWLRTDTTPPKLFVCEDATTGSAVWRQVLLAVQQDSAPKLGGNLDVNGQTITSAGGGDIVIAPASGGDTVVTSGKVGIGTSSPYRLLHIDAGSVQATPVRIATVGAGLNHIELEDTDAANGDRPFAYFRHDQGTLKIGNANRSGNETTGSVDRLAMTAFGQFGIGTVTPTSILQVAGPIATAIVAKTAAYTLTSSDSTVLCDASGGAFTATLPTAVGIAGRQYTIKRTNSGSNAVTVGTTSSETIDGSTTYVLSAQYDRVTVVSDGANWMIV